MPPMAGSAKGQRMNPEFKKVDRVTLLVTTFLGSGMLPIMPGTYGSLLAAAVAYPLALVLPFNLFSLLSLLVFFAAIPFVNKAMAQSKTKDPGWIVIDEVSGQWLAFAFLPLDILIKHPWLLFIGFALFRFFDILKPLGIRRLEKLPGAWGVMTDDLLGGFYAAIVLSICTYTTLM